jgi:hypothetical protein
MTGPTLSKSRILSGWQCRKRLWLEIHDPEKAVTTPSAERAFAIGHRVGDAARQLFPGGVLIGPEDPDDRPDLGAALRETRERLRRPGPLTLFEATFRHEGVLVRCDVLVRDAGGRVRLIEVKASTKVKPVNHIDCAVQAWVLDGAGLRPDRIELAHIDNRFVYPGGGDYSGLFAFEDLTDKVMPVLANVPGWLETYRDMLAGPVPEIAIGPQCRNPWDCPFIPHCTPPGPAYPTRSLPGGGKAVWQLLAEGVDDIRDIPPGRLTSPLQERVRRITAAGAPELDGQAAQCLSELGWPRYYFDFETVSFPIPVWPGTRPYQALPFQWSCHVEAADGGVEHREWLADGGEAPMRACAESLIEALETTGPVFVYTGYEGRVLADLARQFPDLGGPVEAILARLVDLHPLTRDSYYHPDMRGSWSIKNVLPVIAPDLDYANLGEIQEGNAASDAFIELIDPATRDARRTSIRRDLLRYCRLDTEALLRLRHFLSGAS